jgi:hypothetical protein
MQWCLPFSFPDVENKIRHSEAIYLNGSCFTTHMGRYLSQAGFRVAQNTHGVVFNPLSICRSVQDIILQKQYCPEELFQLNEYWHSWNHHSDYSALESAESLHLMNQQILQHHAFLKEARCAIFSLGSAFAYFHLQKGIYVSNNHRAPHDWFRKDLLEVDVIRKALEEMCEALKTFNPQLQIYFTISPVRHVRDGVIENNRSKARLIEAVHQLKEVYYFPAYEIVTDELRDYRFYDADKVHPNYEATQYVWERFKWACINAADFPLMEEMEQLNRAARHQAKDVRSEAHQAFKQNQLNRCISLESQFPYLDLSDLKKQFRHDMSL